MKVNPVLAYLPPNLLPSLLAPAAFIAGGFAAHQDLATDIDVWVQTEDLHSTRRLMLTHLSAYGFPLTAVATEMEQFTGDSCGYEDITANILKVARVDQGNQKPIHLMVTDAPPLMLLLNFDISTHQIALTESGVIRGPEWTDVTDEPVVIKNHGTSKTGARLEKIRARYAHLRRAA